MKTHRIILAISLVVTLANLALLIFELRGRAQPAAVLRTQALELVDARGRVRAELRVTPAAPNFKMPDGTIGYPEAVLLRLIDSGNGPNVKLTATEDGAGLLLGGQGGYVQLLSRGPKGPFVKLVANDGREEMIKP